MNMDRKYIEKVLEDMKERLEYVKDIKSSFEKEGKEYEIGSYGAGLHKGHVMAYENEIEFLKRKIKFLSGALEVDID